MSMSDRYLAYLDQHVEIAPANSEEEVQAAQLIEQLLGSGGEIQVEQQDFECRNDTSFIAGIVAALFFVGVVIAGIGGIAPAVLGFIIAIICFVLLALRFTGHDLIASILPAARSQNVIGFHKGCGPHAGKGVRPIVVMAHYDTGHEEPLANPSVARFSGILSKLAPIGAAIAAVCCLLELFVALPEPFLRIVWVVGMVCALPALALGVNDIAARFMPLTGAANDNNSSVAAMLGVAEDVRSTDPATQAERMAALQVVAEEEAIANEELAELGISEPSEPQTRTVTETRVIPQQVKGVRHGKAVLEALGMLPEGCEIVYIEPEPMVVVEERTVEVEPEPETEAEPTLETPAVVIPDFLTAPRRTTASGARVVDQAEELGVSSVGEPTPRSARPANDPLEEHIQNTGRVLQRDVVMRRPAPVDEVTWADTDVPAQDVVVPGSIEPDVPLDARDEVTWADTNVNAALLVDDPAEQGTAPLDIADSDSTMAMPAQEPAPAPDWGQSSFTPQTPRPRVGGNRVSLFDLPDPAADADPLGPIRAPQTAPSQPAMSQTPQPRVRPVVIEADTFAEDEVTPAVPVQPTPEKPAKKSLRERLHLGKHKEQEESMSEWLGVDEDFDAKSGGESIGSWDNFHDDDSWKGGAAKAPEADVSDEELEDAVLDMDYVNLVAHDIWFVATGASELDHAGSKAFLDAHRKDLRGAFLINLSCVGAGDLTLLTEEGFGTKRHVDRRLLRSFDRIARDLHIQLAEQPRGWADTDATPAMRQSIRSATLMGCDFGTVPALAHTAENVPENVEPQKVVEVNRLVSELIRRS